MKVSLKSDGSLCGTHAYDENGCEIYGVCSAKWQHLGVDEVPMIELTIGLSAVELAGKAKMLAPGGKEVRRIEYADGTVDEYPE